MVQCLVGSEEVAGLLKELELPRHREEDFGVEIIAPCRHGRGLGFWQLQGRYVTVEFDARSFVFLRLPGGHHLIP